MLPGEPQKSVSNREELNRVLRPKSHSFRLTHLPVSLSKVRRIFSGFRSTQVTQEARNKGQTGEEAKGGRKGEGERMQRELEKEGSEYSR